MIYLRTVEPVTAKVSDWVEVVPQAPRVNPRGGEVVHRDRGVVWLPPTNSSVPSATVVDAGVVLAPRTAQVPAPALVRATVAVARGGS